MANRRFEAGSRTRATGTRLERRGPSSAERKNGGGGHETNVGGVASRRVEQGVGFGGGGGGPERDRRPGRARPHQLEQTTSWFLKCSTASCTDGKKCTAAKAVVCMQSYTFPDGAAAYTNRPASCSWSTTLANIARPGVST